MSTALFLITAATLLLVALAVVLWLQATQADWRSDLDLRLRAMGAEEASMLAEGPRDPRLQNPVLRLVTHLLWRLGHDEVEPEGVMRGLWLALLLVPLLLLWLGPMAGLVTVGAVLAVVAALIARRAAKRRAQILSQLPDFLESVMRILSAGNSLEVALVQAAHESREPIRPLFISIGRQVRLGAAVDEVLAQAADVHRLHDLRVMAMAASINRRYGGSLRQVFRSLVQAVRGRDTAQRELRALTAETRFSAVVLAVIPVVLTLYILWQNPDYYRLMLDSPGGRVLLILSALLQLTGMFVIWRMMRSTENA